MLYLIWHFLHRLHKGVVTLSSFKPKGLDNAPQTECVGHYVHEAHEKVRTRAVRPVDEFAEPFNTQTPR